MVVKTNVKVLKTKEELKAEIALHRRERVLLLAEYLDRVIAAAIVLRPVFPKPVKVLKPKKTRYRTLKKRNKV